jgi:pantothenate kinase
MPTRQAYKVVNSNAITLKLKKEMHENKRVDIIPMFGFHFIRVLCPTKVF